MLGYKGPAQPSPALGDALNAGYRYLEVRCLGYDTHQTVALDIVRRPKTNDAVSLFLLLNLLFDQRNEIVNRFIGSHRMPPCLIF